jgi:hypothetical protein
MKPMVYKKAQVIDSEKALLYKLSTTLKPNQYILIRQRKSGNTLNLWRVPKKYYEERILQAGKKAWLNINPDFISKFRQKSGFAFAIWRIRHHCMLSQLTCSPIFVVKHNKNLSYYYLVITTAANYELLRGGK